MEKRWVQELTQSNWATKTLIPSSERLEQQCTLKTMISEFVFQNSFMYNPDRS